ncbi:spore coat protein U domain-containing protein [Oligella ureolytica]|uniref:Spore coat protein U domain-containing protein n=1 Tax=Oligella ureolytica TaxID=90244 RepID=A0A7T3BRH7_9BURK|nr:spore coat protein U domain-containing protein [Oligella ureolytica]
MWGDGSSGTVLASQTGTGSEVTHTIYGRVLNTNHTVGNYLDTVTATVTF